MSQHISSSDLSDSSTVSLSQSLVLFATNYDHFADPTNALLAKSDLAAAVEGVSSSAVQFYSSVLSPSEHRHNTIVYSKSEDSFNKNA